MNLLILGARGATGQEIVNQALEGGHHVTALARDPSKLGQRHENLAIIKGNVLNENDIENALNDKDAVISALGVGKSLNAHDLMTDAAGILIPAMNKKNVRRLILISAFGVGPTYDQASFIQRIAFRLPLRNVYADKLKADEQIKKSDLDWTLIYPVYMTNKPRTGNYQIGEKFKMKGFPKISRADVADFIVRQLTESTYVKRCPVLTSTP